MANDLEIAKATLRGLDTLVAALVEDTDEKNQRSGEEIRHALWWIIRECCEPNPNIDFIQRCAERAIRKA